MFLHNTLCASPITRYFPYGPWSKVMHYKGNRVSFMDASIVSNHHTMSLPPSLPSESPVRRVFVARQRRSLWLAVCEYRGDGIRAHLSWVLPDNTTGHISFRSGYEGVRVLTNLTYEFPLALHEGQDLTCLFQNHHGLKERRTVHVPRYCKCNRE